MFCYNCGNQVANGSAFCAGCGANQSQSTTMVQPNTVRPIVQQANTVQASVVQASNAQYNNLPGGIQSNYEYKTVKCYPSDEEENRLVSFYVACGWEFLTMDRVSESYTNGWYYENKSSTHIKLRRDTTRTNHEKIKELSNAAEQYLDASREKNEVVKKVKWKFIPLIISGGVIAAAGLLFSLIGWFIWASTLTSFLRPDTFMLVMGIGGNIAFLAGLSLLIAAIVIKKNGKVKIAQEDMRIAQSNQENLTRAYQTLEQIKVIL